MAHKFVSGLPPVMPKALAPLPKRTLDEALGDFLNAPVEREKARTRRRYSRPGTPATRRLALRMLGERDE
jgi:hypothetical protein